MSKFIINYQSGHQVKVTAESMSVKRNVVSGAITELKWDGMKPHAMYLNLEAIESIWELT